MPISPWYVTQTNPPFKLMLVTDTNGGGPDLTGLAPSAFKLEMTNSRGLISYGAGSFKVVQAIPPNVRVDYKPNANDVTVADTYTLKLIVNFPDGPEFFGPYTWPISPM